MKKSVLEGDRKKNHYKWPLLDRVFEKEAMFCDFFSSKSTARTFFFQKQILGEAFLFFKNLNPKTPSRWGLFFLKNLNPKIPLGDDYPHFFPNWAFCYGIDICLISWQGFNWKISPPQLGDFDKVFDKICSGIRQSPCYREHFFQFE